MYSLFSYAVTEKLKQCLLYSLFSYAITERLKHFKSIDSRNIRRPEKLYGTLKGFKFHFSWEVFETAFRPLSSHVQLFFHSESLNVKKTADVSKIKKSEVSCTTLPLFLMNY